MITTYATRKAVWYRSIVLIFLSVCAVSLYSQEEPGSLLSSRSDGRKDIAAMRQLTTPMFDVYKVPYFHYEVNEYSITFTTRDFDETMVTAKARVFVPVSEAESYPLLVFGSGTTGVSDKCAPSLEQPSVRRWGHYEANMLAYAGNGLVAAFPDYIGFNDTDRPQRYFSKMAEGHLMLDTVRAVREFLAVMTSTPTGVDDIFLAGYSQGGHAAFSAADVRDTYAPEIDIKGIISYGGTMNVETLLREGAYYAPYIFYTYEKMYGTAVVDPADYLQEQWFSTLEEDVLRMCVDEFQRYYPFDGTQLYKPEFYDALMQGRLSETYPGLKSALDKNIAGLSGHGIPALIIQGERDAIITTAEQKKFTEALKRHNSSAEMIVLNEVRHRFTRAAGYRPTLDWIQEITEGGIAW